MKFLDQIDKLTVQNYIDAFKDVEKTLHENDKKILQLNFEAPNYTITAKTLAKKLNFKNYNGINLRYGSLSGKICDYFNIHPDPKIEILVYLAKVNKEWHWTLREKVVKAIIQLNWFDNSKQNNILNEIEEFQITEKNITRTQKALTQKEILIQSRIGQGVFRNTLIKYWQGCSVTGYKNLSVLKASHIKPWRISTNEERLNVFNGLLLLPNLDVLFDLGYISFENNGKIIISSLINSKEFKTLGLDPNMKLRKIEKNHWKFLDFHRKNIFKAK